jgi:hypothetical protein
LLPRDAAALFAILANGNPQCDDWRKPFLDLALAVVLTTCEPSAYGFHQPHPNRIIHNCIFLSLSVHEAYLYCRSLSIVASALLQPAVAELLAGPAVQTHTLRDPQRTTAPRFDATEDSSNTAAEAITIRLGRSGRFVEEAPFGGVLHLQISPQGPALLPAPSRAAFT